MDDLACPRCKTTKYRNPSLKLMVNVCGHALCESCVDLLFVKGSGACPQCAIPLRRNNFRIQVFEDAYVEKEVDIRRRILRDFNKREEDFETLREYNDYLEEIECIIYNLVNNVNVEYTKGKIEQYKKENRNLILKNKGKLSREDEMLQEMIEWERQESELRHQQMLVEEKKSEKAKVKKKEELIDALMSSDLPAGQIIATHCVPTEKHEAPLTSMPRSQVAQFSTGIKLHQHGAFLPVPKQSEENMYSYSKVQLDLSGPKVPQWENLEAEGYINHVRGTAVTEKAGGFVSEIACHRALQEAFCGLYFTPEKCFQLNFQI